MPEKRSLILAAGLGNSDITPDALGPAAARRIFATRHIPPELSKTAGLENLRQVAVIAPGKAQRDSRWGRQVLRRASL